MINTSSELTCVIQRWLDEYWNAPNLSTEETTLLCSAFEKAVRSYGACCNPGVYAFVALILDSLKRYNEMGVAPFVINLTKEIDSLNKILRDIYGKDASQVHIPNMSTPKLVADYMSLDQQIKTLQTEQSSIYKELEKRKWQ